MDYLTLFAALLALLAFGICLGLLWQWLMASGNAHIRALELQRNDAHEEMVQQKWCCECVPELESRVRELEQALADLYDDEDDDEDYSWDYVADDDDWDRVDWIEYEAVLNWSHE